MLTQTIANAITGVIVTVSAAFTCWLVYVFVSDTMMRLEATLSQLDRVAW